MGGARTTEYVRLRLRSSASLLLVLAALADLPLGAAALTIAECATRGFRAGETACGTCAIVRKALGEASEHAADCAACCSGTLDWRDARRYDSAILQLSRGGGGGGPGMMMQNMQGPGISGALEFLEKGGEAEFPELTVWDVPGETPYSQRGKQRSQLSISSYLQRDMMHSTPWCPTAQVRRRLLCSWTQMPLMRPKNHTAVTVPCAGWGCRRESPSGKWSTSARRSE